MKGISFSPEMCAAIQWVIIGGESGNESGIYRYRPFSPVWASKIMGQFRAANPAGTAFFLKQTGTFWAKKLKLKGDRHGRHESAWPFAIVPRDFPDVDHPAMQDADSMDWMNKYTIIGEGDGPIILKSK